MPSHNRFAELIFIDPTVADYQNLVKGAVSGAEVIILDPRRDGVEQIGEVLAARRGISSIHIVGHGAAGRVQLGNAILNDDNLDSYGSWLKQWGASLTEDADILLYGCDVAGESPFRLVQSRRGLKPTTDSESRLKPTENPILQSSLEDFSYETGVLTPGGGTGEATGIDFIQHLAQLTGADIAASTDKTGSAAVGGNWEFEANTGKIEAEIAFQPEVTASYNHLLALNFTSATNFGVGSVPNSVTVGNFNADSFPDLAVANNGSDDASILLGNGTGGFSAPTNFAVGNQPRSVAIGNFNADSFPDLAVANQGSSNVSILLGNGTGGFSTATNFGASNNFSLAVGNFNADSYSDLAAGESDVSILLANGAGGFGTATNFALALGSFPVSVAVGNFNADSFSDLVVANGGYNYVSILLGNGAGGFGTPTTFGVGSFPTSIAVGNFNADSIADLAVTNYTDNNVSILLGNGAGGFSAPTNFDAGTNPFAVAVGNFNADSFSDLAVANNSSNDVSILLGNGAGGFSAPTNFDAETYPRAIAVGNFNGDGQTDLAVANEGSNNISILLNNTTAPVGNADTAAITVGTPNIKIDVLGNDTDANGDYLKVQGIVTAPTNGTATINDWIYAGGNFSTVNGTSRNRIARLNSDGSLDTSFNPGSGMNSNVYAIALQSDGKPVFGGAFSTVNGTTRNRIARLNGDGSLDTSFDPGSGMNGYIEAIALQSDGKPFVGGGFTTVNGTTRNYIARLNSNGSLDTSFDPGTGMDGSVYAIALQSDGKPVVGGLFTTVNGTTRNRIARLNSDGSLNTSFDPGSGMNNRVNDAIALQSDGKPLVGGGFTSVNGTTRNYIARLNSNGSLDTSFDPGLGMNSGVNSLALQSDGKPLVGGDFTSVNGTTRNYIARLNGDGSLDTSFDPGLGMNSGVNALAVDRGRSITYTPNPGFNGVDTFTYTLSDGTDTTTATATILVNNSPILLNNAGNPYLTNTEFNDTANGGTLISELIARSGGISDVNGGSQGIALIAQDTSSGSWQYTTNGGTNWNAFPAVSASNALLLLADANTRIRFIPNPNYVGTLPNALTFHAWDGIAFTNGSTADVTTNLVTNGASSPFSTATETASITVNPTISIADVTVNEGNSGTLNAVLTVSLNGASTQPITVDFATANNTAISGDYLPTSGTLTFNPGETSKTVSATVNGDAVSEANESFFVNLSNLTNATIADAQGIVNIQDDDTVGITVSTISGNTTESGGTGTFTVVLNSQPTDNVTVNLSSSNPAEGTVSAPSLTFTPANWNLPQTVTVTGVDDAVADGNIAYNIVTAPAISNDAAYNNFDAADVAGSNTDNDSPAVLITQTNGSTDVAEGGAPASYTAILATQPTSNVIITVTPDAQTDLGAGAGIPINLTFTAANWNVAQTVTVTATDDASFEGNHTSTITHAVAAGSAAEYLPVTIGNVTANITDNDSPGVSIIQSGGNTNITEGGAADSYTVVLTTQPTSNVIVAVTPDAQTDLGAGAGNAVNLTFTSANWNVAQTVNVTAIDDILAQGDRSINITHAVVTGSATEYLPVTIGNVTANITDNDSPGVSIIQSGGSTDITEGGAADSYTVVLTTQPSSNVIVAVTPDAQTDLGAGAGNAVNLTFTSANWNVAQTVNVTAIDDTLAQGDRAINITHAVAAGSATEYLPVTIGNVTANITDNDSPGVSITQSGGSTDITEGGAADSYTVVLTTQPSSNVIVAVTPDAQTDLGAGAGKAVNLTFTAANWNVAQTVNVTAIDDTLAEGNHNSSINHAVAAGSAAEYLSATIGNVIANITDNDSPGVSINQSGGSTDITEGGATDTYTVVLTTAPTAPVTVKFNTDGQINAISSLTLDSTNWNVPQTITVQATDDTLAEGNRVSAIQPIIESADVNYNGLAIASISANITDNDSAGVSILPSGGSTDVIEGGSTDSYDIVLTTSPTAPVTISFNTGNQINPIAAITFDKTNWNVAQTVTVVATDDALAEGIHNSGIAHTVTSADAAYNGLNVSDAIVSISDNDSPGVLISQSNGSTGVANGIPDSFTVILATPPSAPVTITFNTDDSIQPIAPLVFDSTNWNVPQTVNIALSNTANSGNYSSTIGIFSNSADANYNGISINSIVTAVNNILTPAVSLVQSDNNTTVSEGGAADTYTIALKTQPSSNVTIAVKADAQVDLGAGAGKPINLTFTTANWNQPQTVNVKAVDDNLVQGDRAINISHSIAAGSAAEYLNVAIANVSAKVTDNDSANVAIAQSDGSTNISEDGGIDTYTIVLKTAPTAPVTIKFSTDSQVNAIAPITFNSSNWNVAQTVTVKAINDAFAENTHASAIQHTIESADPNYQGVKIASVTATIADNDTAGVKITPINTNIAEGGAEGSYTVTLTSAPTSFVSVNFNANERLEAIAPLIFDSTNWNLPQTVKLKAKDDNIAQGNSNATITHTFKSEDFSYNEIASDSVTVAIADNDSSRVLITPISNNATEGGASASYKIVLTSAPNASVLIKFNTDNQILAIPDIAFDRTNWNIPRTLTVTAVNDNLAEGNHSSTIRHTVQSADANFNNLKIDDFITSITDNDSSLVSLSTTNISVGEAGKTGSYDVVLTTQPKAPVTINFKTDEQVDGIAPITFDKTNWNIAQKVTVKAVNDPLTEGDHNSAIAHSVESADADYNGIGISEVAVDIEDNDPAGVPITLPVGSLDLIEGVEEDIYKLALVNQPTSDVTIKVSTDAQTAIDKKTFVFTRNNWNIPQIVKIRAIEDSLFEGNHTSIISFTATSKNKEYNGRKIKNIIANISDNDNLGIVKNLSESANLAEGDRDDFVKGSPEEDIIHGRNGNDNLNGGNGDDIIYGGNGSDAIIGSEGNDQLYGGEGYDYINGNAGSDLIFAAQGNDRVRGGAGNDQLFGEEGNDYLFGDRGADLITGGLGNDAFAIGLGMGGRNLTDADIITDFNLNEDVIDLIGSLPFNRLTMFQGTGANAKDTFIQDTVTSEYLAILQGISAPSLNLGNFV